MDIYWRPILIRLLIDTPGVKIENGLRYIVKSRVFNGLLHVNSSSDTSIFTSSSEMSRATSWRVKRLISGANTDPKKRAHADYVRFSRALGSINQKGNDIFIDGRDTGRERHVYIIVRSRKGRNFTYATYNSNPDEDWVPPTKEVVGNNYIKLSEAANIQPSSL